MVEIERKFLLKDKSVIKLSDYHYDITQFYITNNLRFRKDKDGFRIELKRRKNFFNYENHLLIPDFIGKWLFKIFNFSIKRKIQKTRYVLNFNDNKFEIDYFPKFDSYLVEVEFDNLTKYWIFPDDKPNWLGDDVTNNPNYFNCNLSKVNNF
jgi:adenylate cyclase